MLYILLHALLCSFKTWCSGAEIGMSACYLLCYNTKLLFIRFGQCCFMHCPVIVRFKSVVNSGLEVRCHKIYDTSVRDKWMARTTLEVTCAQHKSLCYKLDMPSWFGSPKDLISVDRFRDDRFKVRIKCIKTVLDFIRLKPNYYLRTSFQTF